MGQTEARTHPWLDSSSPPLFTERMVLPADREAAWHRHTRAQIVVACAGTAILRTAEARWTLRAGLGAWLPSSCLHQAWLHRGLDVRSLYLAPVLASRLPAAAAPVVISPLIAACVERLAARADANAPLDARDRHVVAVLLDELAYAPQEAALQLVAPCSEHLERVCRAMRDDPAAPHTLDDLAKLAGVSRRTLTRRFAEETGTTIAEYRTTLRILAAIDRLKAGASVTSVAFDVGYDNPSAFAAAFRRLVGRSPREFARDGSRWGSGVRRGGRRE